MSRMPLGQLSLLASVLLLSWLVGVGLRPCRAEDPEPEPPPSPPQGTSLPESFGLLRPIYFFRGQASGLLPGTFRPVSIEQLNERLSPLVEAVVAEADRPRLARAVYVARLSDNALVSDQTTWEVSHSGRNPGRLSLGSIGLAIRSAGWLAGGGGLRTGVPPLETDSEGNVSVMVTGDTRLSIAWTAAGRESDREVAFDLSIPPAAQARWLVAVPMEMRLESPDGVLQSLPSPPPEATVRDSGRNLSWYGIEAGGLSRLRLRAIKAAGDNSGASLIVRQASLFYELLPSTIRFSARLMIDPPTDGVLPPLRSDGIRITSASIAGAPARWTESSAEGEQWVQLQADRGELASRGSLVITIDGEANWGSGVAFTELPWIEFRNAATELVGQPLQARITVDSRLELMRLGLPAGWDYLSAVEVDDLRSSFRVGGPWVAEPPTVRVAPAANQVVARSLVRLSATETRYVAVLESSIALSESGPRPILLRVEPGWTVENVLLPQTGRVVELPPEFANDRTIPIWPTTDELDDRTLRLRVVGYQNLRLDGDVATYPASSFAGFLNARNRLAAVATPPAGFRWTPEASLLANRVEPDQLSAAQRELLGDLAPEALLLDISRERIDSLVSRRPVAAFTATNLVRLSLENQRVQETHLIRCDSAVGQLDQVRIELEAGTGPELTWSVDPSASPARRLIRARRLSPPLPENVDPREIWELTIERTGSRGAVLVGRREHADPPWLGNGSGTETGHPAGRPQPLRIELPSIADASSRSAHVIVPDSLRVVAASEGVLRVPFSFASGLIRLGESSPRSGDTMLRYDSATTGWIDVLPTAELGLPTITWLESVSVVISGRGGDWVTADYDTQPNATLVIDCEPGLRLAEVTDGYGRNLDHEWVAGQLVIRVSRDDSNDTAGSDFASLGGVARVRIRWSRPAPPPTWWRRWEPPKLAAAGSVLRRHWRLSAAADTVIPETMLGRLVRLTDGPAVATDFSEPRDSVAVARLPDPRLDPDKVAAVWVLDRSGAMAMGVVFGLLIFAAAWALCGQHPLLSGISLLTVVCLLPTVSLGWGYWIAVTGLPIAAGSLLGTTLGRTRARPHGKAVIGIAETARLVTSLGPLIALTGALSTGAAWGQPPPERPDSERGSLDSVVQSNRRPVVLIPTDVDGSVSGDKVYIPNQFYAELFRDRPTAASPPVITSAVYRLRLDGMTESAMPVADWEIRYSLANLSERSEIQLPVRPSDVRSVQWLPGGESKPLRWSAAGDDRIRIALPPTSSAALLVRLATDVESPERRLRRVRLAIPAVATASLMVDTTVPVQRFDLVGAIGQAEPQAEFGRLSADLGTSGEIRLDVWLRPSTRGTPAITARRFWVHGTPGRGQVECEIDPSEEQAQVGSDFPLVVLGGMVPTLTSADWSLQRSEAITPQRQLLTFRCRRDQPEPIRLLWPIDPWRVAANETEEAVAITLPDVISAGSAPTPPAAIATRAAPGYRLIPLGTAESVSETVDSIDTFVAAWRGYRGTAQQIIRSTGPLNRFLLVAQPRREWRCDERHHLHVRPGEMLLSYEGLITRGERSLGPLRLALPARYEIRRLTVNGTEVTRAARAVGGVTEVLLPDSTDSEGLRVELNARQSLLLTEPFELPRVRIEPIVQVAGTYSLTRDAALRLEQIRPGDLPETDQTHLEIGDQLLGGWIPGWNWRIEAGQPRAPTPSPKSDRPVFLGGTFRAEPIATRVEVIQRAGVEWTSSRWLADTTLSVRAVGVGGEQASLLDDIPVQWPAAWSDQLTVEPAAAWSSQPAIDPEMRIIRIRPLEADRERGTTLIRIRGYRSGEADSLPEIPRPELLGADSVDTYLVVPTMAGTRPLVWTTLSAVADQLPDSLLRDHGGEALRPADDILVFRALGSGANVRLQPSRSEVTTARASLADIQWFPRGKDRGLAMIRWDLEPGDATSVSVRIPNGVTPTAMWIAGRSVPLRLAVEARASTTDDPPVPHAAAPPGPNDEIVTVPFTYTGLAQPLTLLFELTEQVAGDLGELPQLVGVEVGESWLTIHSPVEREPRYRLAPGMEELGWTESATDEHRLALAQSVLAITQASIDGATDRTSEELVSWLRPWDRRVETLRQQARDRSDVADYGSTSTDADAGTQDPSVAPLIGGDPSESWSGLNERWEQYLIRIGAADLLGPPSGSAPFAAMVPTGTDEPVLVTRRPGAALALPKVVPTEMRLIGHTRLLGMLATLGVLGLGVAGWRYRLPLAVVLAQPAFWLFALGLASLAFAPVPVAIAICFVAVSGPLLAGRPGPQRDSKARFGL